MSDDAFAARAGAPESLPPSMRPAPLGRATPWSSPKTGAPTETQAPSETGAPTAIGAPTAAGAAAGAAEDVEFAPTDRLAEVTLDEDTLADLTPEVEQERRVAIFDLLEENRFRIEAGDGAAPAGPYALRLAIEDRRLMLDISCAADGRHLFRVGVALSPFRRVVKDYFVVCDSYFKAVKTATPAQIEAIDMGRRGLHNDGSQLLRDRLAGKIDIDFPTARRLFTLVSVLHFKR